MEISEVRVKLVENNKERLKAFCSITLENDFVIRDLKVIDGTNGPFVAMPSRKLADRCPQCGHKNHLRARFCNECGKKLAESRAGKKTGRRTKLHADIAHPINANCRERIQNIVVEAYQNELEKSKLPGYRPQHMDVDLDSYDGDMDDHGDVEMISETPRPAGRKGGRRDSEYDNGGGYDDLIAELRQDAQRRRRPASDTSSSSTSHSHSGRSGIEEQDVETGVSDDDGDDTDDIEPLSSTPHSTESSDEFGAGIL